MEPIRTTIDDCANNSKYNEIIHSTTMLSIPLIRCDHQVFKEIIKQENIDHQVFDGIIKEEIIDEADHLNARTKAEEKRSTITDTDIKVETEFMNLCEYEGTVLNENDSSQFIACMNLDLKSNCLRKNPLADNCHKMFDEESNEERTSDELIGDEDELNNDDVDNEENDDDDNGGADGSDKSNKMLKCKICSKYFRYKCWFARHMVIHNTAKFTYDYCPKTYIKKLDLIQDSQLHTLPRRFKCRGCPKLFNDYSNMCKHWKQTHDPTKEIIECNICKENFTCKRNLRYHMNQHNDIKPYKCNKCSECFWRPNLLCLHKKKCVHGKTY